MTIRARSLARRRRELHATVAVDGQTIEFDAAITADVNRAFDAGTITSARLVQLCFARIRAHDRQGPSPERGARSAAP